MKVMRTRTIIKAFVIILGVKAAARDCSFASGDFESCDLEPVDETIASTEEAVTTTPTSSTTSSSTTRDFSFGSTEVPVNEMDPVVLDPKLSE